MCAAFWRVKTSNSFFTLRSGARIANPQTREECGRLSQLLATSIHVSARLVKSFFRSLSQDIERLGPSHQCSADEYPLEIAHIRMRTFERFSHRVRLVTPKLRAFSLRV